MIYKVPTVEVVFEDYGLVSQWGIKINFVNIPKISFFQINNVIYLRTKTDLQSSSLTNYLFIKLY